MPDLIPAIVQSHITGQVLMLGYTDKASRALTTDTGLVHFYSRSRNCLWLKGETSGNYLRLVQSAIDCDGDTLLYTVIPEGPTCHRGTKSCFTPEFTPTPETLTHLEAQLLGRIFNDPCPERPSYTQGLYHGTRGHLMRKLIEEAAEVSDAFVEGQENLADEAADLLYHLTVLLIKAGVPLKSVYEVLRQREK